MNDSNVWIDKLSSQGWATLEHIIHRFENAWQQGHRPMIDDYLPNEPKSACVIRL